MQILQGYFLNITGYGNVNYLESMGLSGHSKIWLADLTKPDTRHTGWLPKAFLTNWIPQGIEQNMVWYVVKLFCG